MINVEGNYEEILEDLNMNRGPGVQYADSHGITYEDDEFGMRRRVNFGLFSVMEDFRIENVFSTAAADMSFDPVTLKEALNDWDANIRAMFPRERNV